MKRIQSRLLLALLAGAALHAATVNTTLTVNATGAISASGITVSGTATLTNIGNGQFSATASLTGLTGSSIGAPYTITLSGGTLTGTVLIPSTLLTGASTSATGSATVTGGTGSYAGATGSFPSLSGSGGFTPTGGITLTFTGAGSITTGGTGGGGGGGGATSPTITAVLDAGSYTKNIAQGSIFVVKGSNLSASGFTQLSFPLPTTSGGVKITFTPASGGSGTDAYLVYLYNQSGVNQLAAVLPSTVATGNYNVTVTNNGAASTPFSVTVVQRKLGLITQDSTGTGLAVVQNYISATQLDVDRFTTGSISGITISPAIPGQVLIAWATGMGPVSGGDNTASPGFDFTKNGVNVQVIVGGMSIAPLYAGRAPGLAGADQINFQLPSNIPTGCAVSFQVSVNGTLSNPGFIAIAPDASSSACVMPGFTAQQLQNFDQGGTYTVGAFSLTQFSISVPTFGTLKQDLAGGAFAQINGFQLASASTYTAALLTSGSCQVIHFTGSQSQLATGSGGTILDAGTITLNGPSGSGLTNVALTEDATNTYSLLIGTEGISIPGQTNLGTIVAGTYTLNGAGGKGVGKFNASVTLGSPLSITSGLPPTVTRNAGLTLNWTGGNSGDIVEVVGASGVTTSSGTNPTVDTTEFICTTTAGAGGITVPSSILNQMPAVSSTQLASGGFGFLEVASFVNPTNGNGLFTAPLTAGGNINQGLFTALVGTGATAAYQ